MSPALDDKAEYRAQLRAERDALPSLDREAWSMAICRRVVQLCRSRRWKSVGVFWPLGSEVDLRPAVHAELDWRWYFPRVTSTDPPRLAWGLEPLRPGLWGLMEPEVAFHFLPPVDLLLVPGLAFNGQGFRIGYGGGFYDALLAKLSPEIPTLGVGYGTQMNRIVPVEAHDQPVQGLLSERGLEWLD